DGDIVSETSVPPSVPVRQGRVFVAVSQTKNTGLAIANNQGQPAVISFYFTNPSGVDFGHGTFTLEAKHTIATFVNQAPVNLSSFTEGTLTFTSSVAVAVTALQSLTNERGEFLMTTLPVGPVGTGSNKSIVLAQIVNGGGWSSEVVLTNPSDKPLTGT